VTAAGAFLVSAFTARQEYSDDADYSVVSWLIHRTGITKGAAVGHTAWAKRTGTHPRVLAALAVCVAICGTLTAFVTDDKRLPGRGHDRRPAGGLARSAGSGCRTAGRDRPAISPRTDQEIIGLWNT
jgi:hypothetical protein